MNADEQKKRLRDQLYKANTIYSWEYQGAGQKYTNLAYWILSIFSGGIPLLFLWSVTDLTIDSPVFFGLFILSTTLVFIGRYLFAPDKDYCYHLTPMGIHYTEQDMIPEVAYKIARGFAWVGIVVCIIVAFMFGPLALVGAGAFALMSFGMTNFQSAVDKSHIFIDERSVVFHIINDGVVSLAIPEKGAYGYIGDIYTQTLEQKTELLSHLKLLFPEMEIVKIKRLNDQYKHPVYQQDEVAE